MKIENGKIVEATESELFDRWLSCDHCEIYPFPYYKLLQNRAGVFFVLFCFVLFCLVFLSFLGLHPWHTKVPRLGV